jgi:hypothetical protein
LTLFLLAGGSPRSFRGARRLFQNAFLNVPNRILQCNLPVCIAAVKIPMKAEKSCCKVIKNKYYIYVNNITKTAQPKIAVAIVAGIPLAG